MSLKSMTGFAAAQGAYGIYTWSWDIRSVNAKGLDLRLRVPDWLEGLENALKKKMGAELGRGNVSLALRLSRAEEEGAHLRVNDSALKGALGGHFRCSEGRRGGGHGPEPAQRHRGPGHARCAGNGAD